MLIIALIYAALYVFVAGGMVYEAVSERKFPTFFFKYFAFLSVGLVVAFIYA